MNFAEFWMGSSGPGPTPPTPPEGASNSLRFRGGQYFSSENNTIDLPLTTFTLLNGWVKASVAT